jgi:ABC-2 type transport system permease protein
MTGRPLLPALRAVFWREFAGYFSNPTGYVFITLFVFLSAVAAFWQESFFLANLANLDPLNRWFPYLLVFLVPSIAMGLWSQERQHGTEELLLTLPARDAELVLGKYLAALAIYTVALLFSLSHVVVLLWLGNPDPGLMLATYAGYWLMGAALLPLALLASQLTENLTIAFILGSFLCAVPVFLFHSGALLTGAAARLAERLSVVHQFRDLAAGVLTAQACVYFLSIAAAVLTICVAITGRRRWRRSPGSPPMPVHVTLRGVSAIVCAAAFTVLAGAWHARIDVTSEQIHTLAPETRRLLGSLDPRRPVLIQAFFSPDVPRAYLPVRNSLLAFLREFDAAGRERIETRIVETVKYSPEAREARERYNISPLRVASSEESASRANEIFLGLVFSSGADEFVIPQFDRGLPVEYELMRSIRVVARAARRKVGILDTPARPFGGFDFQSKRQSAEWPVVAELRKQYDVVQVGPDAAYPQDLDVLVAIQPSALAAPQLDRLNGYIAQGKPALLLLDPLPAFNLSLSPASQEAATDLTPLLRTLGIEWRSDRIVWDNYNPHPQLRSLPPEIVFVARGNQAPMPFQSRDAVTSGLQEVVLLYPGLLRPRAGASVEFTPLMTAGKDSGTVRWTELVQPSMFGGFSILRGLPHTAGREISTIGARVRAANGVNAIVIADADWLGEEFFEIRRRGVEGLNFDNVGLALNAIDSLAGDSSFLALRKRRPRYRTLEKLEEKTRAYEEKRRVESEQAAAQAELRLKEAQARLDAAVRALEARADLDEQTRQIMISNVQSAENRRLQVARANINDERGRALENARIQMESSIRGVQSTIKLLAVGLPPIPAFLLAVLMALRRLNRERLRISSDRSLT